MDERTKIDPQALPTGIGAVTARIAEAATSAGRSPDDVTVLAAVKYLEPGGIEGLLAGGVHELAENRLDQLVTKQEALAAADGVGWHYIGRVQSRQVGDIARRVRMIHALTSQRAAARLATLAREQTLALPELLVQVNVARDPAKDGLLPEDLDAWFDSLDDEIAIAGLMTMPAFTEDPGESRGAFAELRELRDTLAARWGDRHPVRHLSMGTSQDFAVAVEEGATHVRLGRILFTGEE